MAQSEIPEEVVVERVVSHEDRLESHDERISANEKFKYMVLGALGVLSLALSGGLITALILHFLGI